MSGERRDLVDDYDRHGFRGRVGFGDRPALLIVDFIRAYTDPDSPLCAAPAVPAAIAATQPLLDAFRARSLPVVFTRVAYEKTGQDAGLFLRKVPALEQLCGDGPLAQIVEELRPRAGEPVLVKKFASAFFGTDLAGLLARMGIDTLVLTGCSTSGCIRATAVDGLQHGFRVNLPRECVGDRAPEPHEASLFDIDGKYGDVVSAAEVLRAIERSE